MDRTLFFSRYAEVIVSVGLNIQPGQELVIRAPVEAAELVPHLVRSAMSRGALGVVEHYRNQASTRAFLETAGEAALDWVAPGQIDERLRIAKRGGAALAILGDDPRGLEGVDDERSARSTRALGAATKPLRQLQMGDAFPWCVVSAPTPVWAQRVYPDLPSEEAQARLIDAVAVACRLNESDPVAAWNAHRARLMTTAAWLTGQAFDHLEYRAPGTELTVGLPRRHRWVGTDGHTPSGTPFVANLPTDEVFTAPDRTRAEGRFRTTRPMVYRGTVVRQVDFEVRDGRIVAAVASDHQSLVDSALDLDEHARRLGELALVVESAPVAQLQTTFFDGLYDENAGCHIAFGMAYSTCHQDGDSLDSDALVAAGLNQSMQHHDVTIGSDRLSVTAVADSGRRVPLIVDGEWSNAVEEVVAAGTP